MDPQQHYYQSQNFSAAMFNRPNQPSASGPQNPFLMVVQPQHHTFPYAYSYDNVAVPSPITRRPLQPNSFQYPQQHYYYPNTTVFNHPLGHGRWQPPPQYAMSPFGGGGGAPKRMRVEDPGPSNAVMNRGLIDHDHDHEAAAAAADDQRINIINSGVNRDRGSSSTNDHQVNSVVDLLRGKRKRDAMEMEMDIDLDLKL